jgi:hypothetical protein
LLPVYSNTGQIEVKQLLSRAEFTNISTYSSSPPLFIVTFSDAIVVVFIVVLGQVHDADCVAARVGEWDSSPVTAATQADSRKSRSSSPTGALGSRSLRLHHTNIS